MNLANGTDLVAGIAGNADVVATLESKLDIANLKGLGATFLGVSASCLDNIVDKLVSDGEN